MPSTAIVQGEIIEGEDGFVMWRPTGANNAVLYLADVTSVEVKLFDLLSDTPDTAVYTEAPAAAAVMFATLQVDGFWDLDATGYTFRYQVRNANFTANGGHIYRVCASLTTTAGSFPPNGWGVVPLITELTCRSALRV